MNSLIIKAQLWLTAALVGVIAAEWGYAQYDRQQLQHQLGSIQPAETAEDSLPSLRDLTLNSQQFSELVERPLFVEGRKPLETASTQTGGQVADTGQLDEWELVGIVSHDRGKHYRALFIKPNDKKPQDFVGINQSIAGWQLTQIENDRVTLQQNGQIKTLFLYKPRKFAGGPQRAMPTQSQVPMQNPGMPGNGRSPLQVIPPVPVAPVPTPMNTEMINDAASENQ